MNLLLHDGGHEEIKLWKIPEYRRHTRPELITFASIHIAIYRKVVQKYFRVKML